MIPELFFKFTNTEDGEDDPIFIGAVDEADARQVFAREIGEIPASMLVVTKVDELPEDADVIR